MPGQATLKYLRVNRSDIAYLQFLLEGYEGLATLTARDPGRGLMGLWVPPGRIHESEAFLRAVSGEIRLEEVVAGPGIDPENRTAGMSSPLPRLPDRLTAFGRDGQGRRGG